ncbi:MAG: hypothetical protein AB8B97_06530 [Granulosicoccus sp.]
MSDVESMNAGYGIIQHHHSANKLAEAQVFGIAFKIKISRKVCLLCACTPQNIENTRPVVMKSKRHRREPEFDWQVKQNRD